MSWCYRRLLRPVLFAQDSEQAHNRALRALAWAGRHELVCDVLGSFFGAPDLPVETLGLRFPNPVGLAAGMDRSEEHTSELQSLAYLVCRLLLEKKKCPTRSRPMRTRSPAAR